MSKQPEALRLADWLDAYDHEQYAITKAAAELRRLHAENAELQRVLNLAHDELCRNLEWLVRTKTRPDGLAHNADDEMIIDFEYYLIEQINKVLISVMAATTQEDA